MYVNRSQNNSQASTFTLELSWGAFNLKQPCILPTLHSETTVHMPTLHFSERNCPSPIDFLTQLAHNVVSTFI